MLKIIANETGFGLPEWSSEEEMMQSSCITIYEFPFALVDLYNTLTFCPYADHAFGFFSVDGGLSSSTKYIIRARFTLSGPGFKAFMGTRFMGLSTSVGFWRGNEKH